MHASTPFLHTDDMGCMHALHSGCMLYTVHATCTCIVHSRAYDARATHSAGDVGSAELCLKLVNDSREDGHCNSTSGCTVEGMKGGHITEITWPRPSHSGAQCTVPLCMRIKMCGPARTARMHNGRLQKPECTVASSRNRPNPTAHIVS